MKEEKNARKIEPRRQGGTEKHRAKHKLSNQNPRVSPCRPVSVVLLQPKKFILTK